MGGVAEGKEGNSVVLFGPEWLRAWAQYHVSPEVEEDDLDSPSADSPWLEEKRKWSAKRERARYEQETGQLIHSEEVERRYSAAADPIRQAGESMCDDCRPLLNDALNEADKHVRATDDSLPDSDAAEGAG